ncbi:MAG: O-antigen ligase family protein [bacterium]
MSHKSAFIRLRPGPALDFYERNREAFMLAAFILAGALLGVMPAGRRIFAAGWLLLLCLSVFLVNRPFYLFLLTLFLVPMPDLIPAAMLTNVNIFVTLLFVLVLSRELVTRTDLRIKITEPGVLFILFAIVCGFYLYPVYTGAPAYFRASMTNWVLLVMGMTMYFFGLYFIGDGRRLNQALAVMLAAALAISLFNVLIYVYFMKTFGVYSLYKLRELTYSLPAMRYIGMLYGNPNVVGGFIAYVASFLAGYVFVNRKLWKPAAALGAVYLAAIVLIASRSALLGAFVPILIFFVLHLKARRTLRWVVVTHLFLFAAALIFTLYFLVPVEYNVIKYTFAEGGPDPSTMQRLVLWKGIAKWLAENPWGFGYFAFKFRDVLHFSPNLELEISPPDMTPHSAYFDVMLDSGIPGFLLFAAGFFLVIRKAFAVYRGGGDVRYRAAAFGVFCALCTVSLLFVTNMQQRVVTFMGYVWFMACLPHKIDDLIKSGK